MYLPRVEAALGPNQRKNMLHVRLHQGQTAPQYPVPVEVFRRWRLLRRRKGCPKGTSTPRIPVQILPPETGVQPSHVFGGTPRSQDAFKALRACSNVPCAALPKAMSYSALES